MIVGWVEVRRHGAVSQSGGRVPRHKGTGVGAASPEEIPEELLEE